jgi:DUF4097 and DUF4098 domain-containing protein YvlB
MTDERKMILQMIEDGKIKADEALLLLEALGKSESVVIEEPEYTADFRESARQMKSEMKEMAKESKRIAKESAREARISAKEIEREARELAREQARLHRERIKDVTLHEISEARRKLQESENDLEESLRTTLDGAGGLVTFVLSGVEKAFGFNVFDNSYTFEEQIEGNFSDKDELKADFIHIQTANGKIECLGWNQDQFRLILTKKIRAGSEEEARAKAESRVTVSHTDSGLIVDGKSLNGINSGMSVELWLPKNRLYDFTLDTGNGRIALEDVNAEGIEIRTSNGRVSLMGVDGKVAHLRSSNGSIRCDGGIPLLTAYTSNGSVSVASTDADNNTFELSTTNGTIRVKVADCDDLAHDFDLSTSFGKVKVNLPGAVGGYQATAKNRLVDTTQNFGSFGRKLRLAAVTSNGNISVNPDEEI